ncbi:SUMF1/EgtB/PvdO family nonheme iron enzyme, partial [Candidatus Marithioploca araucensis]|nr:SUMF1/EgtB/PvdO family nonheme iron enzyme [Candidatus Marithioploca araucensis]
SLIAYATQPNTDSWSGLPGERNSLYTKHLLAKLRSMSHLSMMDVFFAVRDQVMRETETEEIQQVPWESVSLRKRLCFGECGKVSNSQANPFREDKIFRDRLQDGSLGPEMVRIPAGRFRMGDIQGGGDSDEKLVHLVSVKQFAMGKYEITVGEFRRFVNATGYKTEAEKGEGCYIYSGSWGYKKNANWRNPYFSQNETHPVVCVSWNDAVAYAEWLSQQTGKRYRFPTEAEWEYAARAKTTTSRYWGNNPGDACRYANVTDKTANKAFSNWNIHNCTDGYIYTAPVGHFKSNAFELFDMLGNVWEWTCSEYKDEYSGKEKRCTGKNRAPVIRGGSWVNKPRDVRAASRYRYSHVDRLSFVGFRLTRKTL